MTAVIIDLQKTRQQKSAVWLQNGGRDDLWAAHLLMPAHLALVRDLGWIMRLNGGFGRATCYGMLTELSLSTVGSKRNRLSSPTLLWHMELCAS